MSSNDCIHLFNYFSLKEQMKIAQRILSCIHPLHSLRYAIRVQDYMIINFTQCI